MRRAARLIGCLGLLCWPLAARPAPPPDLACQRIVGDYRFVGTPAPDSKSYALGRDPNIAQVLLPDSELAYDSRVSHYRVLFEQDRFLLEPHTSRGPLGRIVLVGEQDFSYCLDGTLVVERQRLTLAGSVYEYSRYRHRLSRSDLGGLRVETDVTGKYRTWLTAWERPREHFGADFSRAEASPP